MKTAITACAVMFSIISLMAQTPDDGEGVSDESQNDAGVVLGPRQSIPRLEVGLLAGEPTGFSAKWFFDRRNAVTGVIGASFVDGKKFNLHADYLNHFGFFSIPRGFLPVYFGLGAFVRANGSFDFGGRIPIGAEYILDLARMAVFAEAAPGIDLIGDPGFVMSGGIGIRIAFGSI